MMIFDNKDASESAKSKNLPFKRFLLSFNSVLRALKYLWFLINFPIIEAPYIMSNIPATIRQCLC